MKIPFFYQTDPANLTCSSNDLSLFTRQLATLLNSGVNLHESLDTLARFQNNKLDIWVLPELAKDICRGMTFSRALRKFPGVFPTTYLALVRAGEEAGTLPRVLSQLAEWLERQGKIEREVKKALTYPLFVIAVASILTLVLFWTVIPGILETVTGLGAELPILTKILMAIVFLVEQPLFWAAFFIVFVGAIWYLRTPIGSLRVLLLCHYLPVVGKILLSSSMARMCQTYSMLLSSGVDIVRGAKISANASGNPLVDRDAKRLVRELKEGNTLAESFEMAGSLYPSILIQMARVGDETGHSARLIGRCGEMMEQETFHALDIFTGLLEPIVLGVVSAGVGLVLLGILMPMSSLLNVLSS